MNILKNTHAMSFELLEEDLGTLYQHAWLAAESGSMNRSSQRDFELEERYLIKQIPQLYEYIMIEKGKFLKDHGGRIRPLNQEKSVFDLQLPSKVAEQYYELQHRHGRQWVLNALINIYERRQETIMQREFSESVGSKANYLYPFNAKEWKFSYLKNPTDWKLKGYHIDVKEPIVQTVVKFLCLTVIDE